MKYLIEADGTYVGGFSDDTPDLAVALGMPGRTTAPSAPGSASQKWTGSGWGPAAPTAAAPLTADQLAALLVQKAVIQPADLVTAKALPPVTADPVVAKGA